MTAGADAQEPPPAVLQNVSSRFPAAGFVLRLAGTAVLVFVLAWLSLALTHPRGRAAPIWLPNAVWLTFVLNCDRRRWPAILLAGLVGNLAADMVEGDPFGFGLALSGSNLLEVLACAVGVRCWMRGGASGSLGAFVRFGVIAAVSATTCSAFSAMWVRLLTGQNFGLSWLIWAAADGLGLLILTPPLMVLSEGGLNALREPEAARRGLRVACALAAAVLLSALLPDHPLALLTLPVLAFAALQLEFAGAALGMLAITAVSLAFIGAGWSPLTLAPGAPMMKAIWFQGFLLLCLTIAFPIAASLARRRALEGELVRTNRALTEANRLAGMAEKLAGVGYWRVVRGQDCFTWSEQMYRIYGLEPADSAPALDFTIDHCHPEDRERLLSHRAQNSDNDAEIEVRIVRDDGEIRHVITRSTLETDETGAGVARFGTLTDVTEIKRAQAAAQANEQRYRFLADNAPDMISRTTVTGETLYVSPSSVRVFGYTSEEMFHQNAREMVHPDDYERVMGGIFRLLEEKLQRLPEPLVYRARHKDGRWIWIEANPTLVFDEQGEPVEFIDIVRNVTQAKQAEAELEDARRRAEDASAAKSVFLANMSHELRTPLTSIIGFARLVGERDDLTDDTRRYVGRITDASTALLSVINDVLDFSKLDAGQVELERRPLCVRQLVDETSGLIAIQAGAKGLTVTAHVDADVPDGVLGDVARLRQVMLNFLSNAVKFTPEGGVTVRASYSGVGSDGKLRIEVTDTGDGIAPDKLDRLFERFSQAEVSINRTHGGTGLGLAISKGIIELMGGTVGVHTRLGEGSTFWFEAPAEAAAIVQEAPASDAKVDLPALKLLVVDDTAVNRELIKLMLAPLGMEIDEAAGGAEALRLAMVMPFDLILMDVRMPGMDGLEATRRIRAQSPVNASTPIIAVTADVQADNAAACREAGMNDHIGKPISPQELLTKIAYWGAQAAEAEQQLTAAL